MAVNNFIYRLKAMPGDTAPHDELGTSGNLGAGITTALVDRGSGDVAWRFSAGATSIPIPANAIDTLAAGSGVTMAITIKIINSGSVSYRAIAGIGADALPLAYTGATTSPGMFFSRHGPTTVRATALGSSYTDNMTAGTTERTYVLRFSVNKSTTKEYIEMWATDPANPGTAAYIGNAGLTISSSNNMSVDVLSIDCSSGIIVEIKDLVVWADEKSDAECGAIALDLRGQLDTVADVVAPTFSGTMTHNSLTSSSCTVDWSACTYADNVGIVAFDTSLNGVDWTARGLVTSYNFTALADDTDYIGYVRARDAAGLTSPVLTRAFTTAAIVVDSTPPVLTGSITELTLTHNSFSGECPVATDNVAVAGYQFSINAGVDWQTITSLGRAFSYESATPATAYPVRMRCFDGATPPNYSTPVLSRTFTTLAAPDAQLISSIICGNDPLPLTNTSGFTIFIQNVTTGAMVATKTNVATNNDGVFVLNDVAFVRGNYYRLIYQRPDGTANPAEGMQTVVAV